MNLIKGFDANKGIIKNALIAGVISMTFDIAKGVIVSKVNPTPPVVIVHNPNKKRKGTTEVIDVEIVSSADLEAEAEG